MYNGFVGTSGSISIKVGNRFYVLNLPVNGWLAAELVQYLGDVIESREPDVSVLKLLGYTMTVEPTSPREADEWVEVDLEKRQLRTNSELIRKAVDQEAPSPADPYSSQALRRIYDLLDKYDFTVRIRK